MKEWMKYGVKLNIKQKEELYNFLDKIKKGKVFQTKMHDSEIGPIPLEKGVTLFTNMNFDTYVLGRNSLFKSMENWLIETIEFWKENVKDIPLYIRAHPGEVKTPTPAIRFVRDIVKPNARSGAESAGRDPDALVFPTAATISINQDVEAARDASRASICKLYHPIPHPYYDSQLRQLGFSEFADQAARLMPLGKIKEAMALVPDEVVDSMTITGNLAQCAARIKEYEGVADELILARTGQRNDTKTMSDYDELFELIDGERT